MSHRVKKILVYILLAGGALGVASCQFFNGEQEELEGEPLARVYNRYLYMSDLKDIIPKGLPEKDSLAFLQNYINVWAKDQLMIYKAEYNLTENKKNFDKRIEEYRNDLLKFAYRKEYIRQNLDTIIVDSAIVRNYNTGQNNFVLKENIVKADYLIVNKEAPELKDAIKWFSSSKKEDRAKLLDYALKYAYKFSLADSTWIGFDQLNRLIPFEKESSLEIIKNREVVQLNDASNVYLVHINDHRLKGETAPLVYARDIIKNILLNKRKLKLLNNLEQNLLDDALKKKEFEVY